MSTFTTQPEAAAPPAFEVPGPVTRVPSLAELYEPTSVPERRVVFRGVDWSFYERLVDSIPETSSIHEDHDGRDGEVVGKGPNHERIGRVPGRLIDTVTAGGKIPRAGLEETTRNRPAVPRGIEADRCFYFIPEERAACVTAIKRRSDDIADYPKPDLAVEVDLSRPQVDRGQIDAALRVPEVWRHDGGDIVIEQLTARGTYKSAGQRRFMPLSGEEIERWVLAGDSSDELAWAERLRTWRAQKRSHGDLRSDKGRVVRPASRTEGGVAGLMPSTNAGGVAGLMPSTNTGSAAPGVGSTNLITNTPSKERPDA